MVNGFTKFKERFQGFENQYVIIGGTACDLIMENEELPFRATKDIDIVLIVESITVEFGRKFWEYVREAGYTRQFLSPEIEEDMKEFLSEITDETVDLKSLGIRGTDKQKMIDMLYECYNLNDNT